jgi:UMF1 family MFS transporter
MNKLQTDKITKMVANKQRTSWYFYDWANSAYTTTVITVFLGPYLTSIANNASTNGYLNILGLSIYANSLFAYVISISVIIQFLIMPPISAIADKLGNNKFLLGLFAYIGAFATILMFYIKADNYLLGVILLIISNVAFGTSIVLYNSFLSIISTNEERDSTSSKGWAIGYLGAALFLGSNLYLVQNIETLGITMSEAVRICLMAAGIWWALFTLIPLWGLKSIRNQTKFKLKYIFTSFYDIKSTLKSIRTHKITFNFLIAYLLYNDGVQAVIALAATFGSIELKLGNEVLISAILLVQFVAFIGSILFNYILLLYFLNLLNSKI